MPLYPEYLIREVADKNDIRDVISQYVKNHWESFGSVSSAIGEYVLLHTSSYRFHLFLVY